jgi:hypothetical protein
LSLPAKLVAALKASAKEPAKWSKTGPVPSLVEAQRDKPTLMPSISEGYLTFEASTGGLVWNQHQGGFPSQLRDYQPSPRPKLCTRSSPMASSRTEADHKWRIGCARDGGSISPRKSEAHRCPRSVPKEQFTATHGEHAWRRSDVTRQQSSPTLGKECPYRRRLQERQRHLERDEPVEVIIAGVKELMKVGDQSDTSTCATTSPRELALGQLSGWLCENGFGSICREVSAPILAAPPVTPVSSASPPVQHRCVEGRAAVGVTDRHDSNELVLSSSPSTRWV